MRTVNKNNNGTKVFSFKKSLEKYIEKNAKYFEKNDSRWSGRYYGRY